MNRKVISIKGITRAEAWLVKKYISTEAKKAKFMSGAEMSEMTGIPEDTCGNALADVKKKGLLEEQYAVFCPKCGKIVDRCSNEHGIRMSGYVCPWCRSEVRYDRNRIVSLFAPLDADRTSMLVNAEITGTDG